MKKLSLFFLPAIAAIVLWSGCGPSDDSAPAAPQKKKKPATTQPVPPAPAPTPAPPPAPAAP